MKEGKGKEKEDDSVDDSVDDYEDSDNESHNGSPTSGNETQHASAAMGPLRKGGKVFLDANRSWTAVEADDAHHSLLVQLERIRNEAWAISANLGAFRDT